MEPWMEGEGTGRGRGRGLRRCGGKGGGGQRKTARGASKQAHENFFSSSPEHVFARPCACEFSFCDPHLFS